MLEVVAGWERVAAWVVAQQGAAVVEFASRVAARERGVGAWSGREHEFTADEIAPRLAVSRAAAEAKVCLGLGLSRAPQVRGALAAGRIDARKAAVLLDEVMTLPRGLREPVQVAGLEVAGEVTVAQLKARLRRIAIEVDPAAAEGRARAAADARRVELAPVADAMAWISAYLPADRAAAVMTAITALASAQVPGDPRTSDQRRADAFSEVFTTILDTGRALDTGWALDTARPPRDTAAGVTASTASTSATGADPCSGEGAWRTLPVEHRRRPHVQVTVAATTLLGLDCAPGELAGYGPVPADMARRIATDGTWRAILTHPTSGIVLHRGKASYRPGADLTALVIARDVTCVFPGCALPATHCDLDHIKAFTPARPASEQTHPDNLHALCRHHHRLKTHAGWTVRRDQATGATHWTTPTGHHHERPPAPAAGAIGTRAGPARGTDERTGPTGDPPY